ncbi:class I SAM-dependent methyltransferase [Streptomyces sp. NPDC093109]|uniref:O-methyltransferase n=1 Tax=Streptomyces sp. NPDC093109 TaxID=3154977 RepID=UPI00344F15E9
MIEHLRITDTVLDYVRANTLRDQAVLRDLRLETDRMPERTMQVLPEQGQLLALLVRLTGANRVLEVGTFTGYSTLCMAQALPDTGTLTTIDINDAWTATARDYWKRADVDQRIDARLGKAADVLADLIRDLGPGSFDMAFIDADKSNYPGYYEQAVTLLRPGGLIVLDNVLWSGKVADPAVEDPDTRGLRAVNERVHRDERVDAVMLSYSDGLTLARKR